MRATTPQLSRSTIFDGGILWMISSLVSRGFFIVRYQIDKVCLNVHYYSWSEFLVGWSINQTRTTDHVSAFDCEYLCPCKSWSLHAKS